MAQWRESWERKDVWLRNAYPFKDRIVTPTLWMAGGKDFNVPLPGTTGKRRPDAAP